MNIRGSIMKNKSKIKLHRHHEDQYIDEIKIRLVPRFKTSGLSGDEWRISAVMEFYRKGNKVYENCFNNMSTACSALPWFWKVADEGTDWKMVPDEIERKLCQQPGCSEPAVKFYEYKEFQISKQERNMKTPGSWEPKNIWFCKRHAHRGDSDLEDNDNNYMVLGEGNSQSSPVDEKDVAQSQLVVMEIKPPTKSCFPSHCPKCNNVMRFCAETKKAFCTNTYCKYEFYPE